MNVGCLEEHTLAVYLDATLDARNRERVESHIDGCPRCFATVAEFMRLFHPARSTREPQRFAKGAQFGRYTLLEVAGIGGTAIVYAAYDRTLQRRVALKLIRVPHTARASLVLGEARAIARLSHPNVVIVHDVGELDGYIYLAMELVEGTTLDSPDPRGGLCRARLVAYRDAGRALAAVHEAGVVHGDFKPGNVVLTATGRAVVLDFGFSRRGPDARSLGGTARYMAPELCEGGVPTTRSDVYAYATSVWTAITSGGSPPRTIPRGLRRRLQQGMDPDASRRPSLGPIIAELDRLLGRTRRRAIAGGLVVTALVGAAAAGFVGSEGPRCPQPNQAIAELWEESIRADLGERLTGRQWEALSDYAQEWATLRVGRCNATWSTGERTPSQLEATNACLGRARARFQAVTQTLASGSQMQLHRASEVVEELYSIDPCAQDEPGNTVPPPHLQIDVERIRAQLERAHTSKVVGPLPDAIAQIEQVVEAARALGFEPLVAEAWVELAGARNALPDPERAEVAASAALELAERHGLAQVRFDAWSERLLALGRQGRYGEALHLLRAAEASLHALPDPRGARAELLAFSGRLHAHVDDPATACKLLEQARAELEALHGSHSVELLGTLTGLTDCRVGLGEIDRARAYAQRALDLARAGLEPGDRRIATALHELAQQDLLAMDFQSALDRSSEAIEVLERTHGPASPALHMPLDIAARAASYQGHHAQAIEFIDRAVRVTASGEPRSYLRSLRQAAFIRVEVAKEERPEARAKLLSEAEGLLDRSEAVVDDLDDPEYERARLHDYRGILFAAGDRWPQAVEATTMALEVYERRGRALAIGPALIARAEAHRNLGDYDAAINDLLAARDGGLATGDRRFRVFAQRNLALVLHEAGRSRQAREQARAALEGYETYPELEREASSAELHQILGSRRAGAGRPGPITPAD